MNARMIPKSVLDKMAGFPVGSLMEESHEITLLGEYFYDAISLSTKKFWKEYRKCSK